MNAQEWNKLRKNWNELLVLEPDEIIADLYSKEKEVINYNDKKEVETETTNRRKMDKLLHILKSKPSETNAYSCFLEALEKDEMTAGLAKVIRDTESTSDSSLKSEVDPHLLDNAVRRVLHKYLANKPGGSTALSKVREILQSNGVFSGKNEWSNTILIDFVCKEFVGVEIHNVPKRKARNSKKEKHFKNITVVDPKKSKSTEKEHEVKLTTGNNEQQVNEAIKVEQMNPQQLKEYLQPKMVLSKLPTNDLDCLVNQNVTGSIFLAMTEDAIKEVIPSVTFGVRCFLLSQISEIKCPAQMTSYRDYLRKFDTEVKHTDKYIKGHCVDAYVNVRGKTTTPVRSFHVIDQGEEEPIQFIMSEMIPFVSACLNNRRNGTIYFGICPESTDQYKRGEVVGVHVSIEDLQAEINDSLLKYFSKSQWNMISGAVRDAKFVPVISDLSKDLGPELNIVEIDICPSSCIMEDVTIRTKLKRLPIHARKQKGTGVFRFSDDGVPEIISSDDMCDYDRDKKQIIQRRQEEEAAQKHVSPPNLRTRLLNLLTGGSEVMQDNIYLFIFTSSIDSHMNEDYLSRNMTFIKHLKPEVVYDFDTTGSTNGLYNNLKSVQGEVMRVLTTDNFDKVQCSREQYKIFTESLAAENRTSWIFCNGYDVMNLDPMEPTLWNRKRRTAFQESLNFFKDNFDEDRIIVIICLFSKMYTVMIEASEEVLTKFPDNWLLLAESEDIAKLWQDQMLSRNKTEKKALNDRCVVGMPWDHVNTTIKHACSTPDVPCDYRLPTSSGALTEVKKKKLKDWCDIDILSGGDFTDYENEKERKKEVEEKFYRGEQVNWLNFYFHDQVLKRDIHEKLMQAVKDALEGKGKEEEDKVTSVSVLHQPGAGGTTSAKQILWDLRREYRCCVLNTITDQTCDQLEEVRIYGDSSPKPLLILIDNEDEDKCLQLRGDLEERGRKLSRQSEKYFNVYCTIVVCIRRASLPKQLKHHEVSLHQELNLVELNWFKEKNESLESRFNKDKERNINPKFLISFNILRENFNKEYISKVVKEFSDAVKISWEVQLLKIISLINTYDPVFKPVPVSCLDKILQHEQNVNRNIWHGTVKRNIKWEANLGQEIKVLLNLSSSRHHPGRPRNSLRVFNKNIAQEILTRMKERTGQKESEIMEGIFESGIFEQETFESKKLQTLISNVIKKRELKEDGGRYKFSKFVIYVKDNEGAEVAVNILEQLFELKEDPFTAQLISRFYIDMKNWSRAEHFAKIATSKLPSNSFLWDTYGRVFKNQLADRISQDEFKDEDIPGLIELSGKCIEVFRKGQEVSENEVTNSDNNFAGYFGELQVIVLLISALKMCPSFKNSETLHKFLVDDDYKPPCLNFLNDTDAGFVKTLEKSSKEAMRRLDEEYLQMKGNTDFEMGSSADYSKKSLLGLKVNLDEYFGEASDSVPAKLTGSDTSEYIRRRVRQLGASSLHSLLTLRQNNKTEIIKQIYSLTMRNIESRSCTFDDWKTILDTVTVLLIDGYVPLGLEFNKILEWCKMLYTMKKPQETNRSYLETFLYYVLYNFPTEERQKFNICTVQNLSSAIEEWQNAFRKNYPKSSHEEIKLRRRETTLFFLGNGSPLRDIVHQDSLIEMGQYSLTEKWDLPNVRQRLRMMSGSLCDHGERVQITITTTQGNKFSLSIKTSHRVTKKDMWQKKVFFYVGFSFSGPRAFGMSTEELGVREAPMPTIPIPIRHQIFSSSARAIKEYSRPILVTLYSDRKEAQLKREKEKNPNARLKLDEKIQEIDRNIKKLIGEPVDD
ncbi:hypothetical protein BsWGS_03944 [Bradybaena similaris]